MTYIGKSMEGDIVSISKRESEIIKDALQLYTARLRDAASIAQVYYNTDCGDIYQQEDYSKAASLESCFGMMME